MSVPNLKQISIRSKVITTSMPVPNLKQVAEFIQKLRGPKISKLGHVTLSHTPFEPETLNL